MLVTEKSSVEHTNVKRGFDQFEINGGQGFVHVGKR